MPDEDAVASTPADDATGRGTGLVEPIPDAPAALVRTDGRRLLAIADFHAGIESALRYERGVNLDSAAPERREHVQSLLATTEADELVVIGDFMHSIGGPGGAERGEIEVLLEELDVPVTVVKGNHDGDLADWAAVDVTDSGGVRVGDVGFAHGHTWPDPTVLEADVVCVGHEHPQVRLVDEVGGTRIERAWLRGPMDASAFANHYDDDAFTDDDLQGSVAGDLVVFPAFNDRCGGTWVNVEGRGFLAPFLPDAVPDAQAYLLDGTRLGRYDSL